MCMPNHKLGIAKKIFCIPLTIEFSIKILQYTQTEHYIHAVIIS